MTYGLNGLTFMAAPSRERCYHAQRNRLCSATMIVALLCAVVLGVGCSKESGGISEITPEESAELTQNVSPDAPPDASQAQPQTLKVSPQDNTDVMVRELNRELARWMVRNRRVPSSFEEFVASAQLNVPPPPAGKKYILKDARVELVSQ